MAGKKPETSQLVDISKLKPHPRNYRSHPEDQIEHMRQSLREHGFYRNVVVAKDFTILAGHGITLAATEEGFKQAPVVVKDIDADSPLALKLLAADNTVSLFAFDDDRALTELLREISVEDELLGTGFDADNLAALLMTTRSVDEIEDFDEAAEWLGMPEYQVEGTGKFQLRIHFLDQETRAAWVEEHGVVTVRNSGSATWAANWPPEESEVADNISLRFEETDGDG